MYRSYLLFLALWVSSLPILSAAEMVNDIHSEMNETHVLKVEHPKTLEDLQLILRQAASQKIPVSIAGGRHAMGGQQFGEGTILIDTRQLKRVLHFDTEKGILEVEAGIQWPDIYHFLRNQSLSEWTSWSFHQKQTGADRMTLGGSISVNAHGRVLNAKPLIQDIESVVIVNAKGEVVPCSRTQNAELFQLVVGGYGLFGVIYSAKLRLVPRYKMMRRVSIVNTSTVMKAFDEKISEGYQYGDFQYLTDINSKDFMRKGILSVYRTVPANTPIPKNQKKMTAVQWRHLIYLAHQDPARAFEEYKTHYLATNGQIYDSDAMQFSPYLSDYHEEVDRKTSIFKPGREMITELYVPRGHFLAFMEDLRTYFLKAQVQPIYGTVRLILKDSESFLAWAKDDYVAIIVNLHVDQSVAGTREAAKNFRRLIDLALIREGSFFLTYHRFASKKQLLTAYPQFEQFMALKMQYDPTERFQSDWYRHYREMFSAKHPVPEI